MQHNNSSTHSRCWSTAQDATAPADPTPPPECRLCAPLCYLRIQTRTARTALLSACTQKALCCIHGVLCCAVLRPAASHLVQALVVDLQQPQLCRLVFRCVVFPELYLCDRGLCVIVPLRLELKPLVVPACNTRGGAGQCRAGLRQGRDRSAEGRAAILAMPLKPKTHHCCCCCQSYKHIPHTCHHV